MSLSMFCKNCDWDAGLVHLTPNSSPLIHLPGAALLHHCDDHDDTHDDKSPVPSWSRSTRPSSQSKCGSHPPPPQVGKFYFNWATNMMNYFLDFHLSAFHRWTGQLTFSKTTWWRWIASLEVEFWIIRFRSHSGYCEKKFLRFLPLSSCYRLVEILGGFWVPPIRPSSGQLHCAPHLKVKSPIFFSLNVNSSIGVSKGIGPSTSATYHGWIRRWWSLTVVNPTVSPLKTSFNTGLTWRQQRPRVTITTQWTRQFINYQIKTSKTWYGCPCNDVRAIRKKVDWKVLVL